jgi:4-amino-4-deoxy-L-arabinose transferase-like glycosyltransferase
MLPVVANDPATPATRAMYWLFAVAGVSVVAHAFVPLDEFVHRTDDAFYYFKTAYNYPETGFWSFDGSHSTNGVQPLWAWLLTAVAQVMAWLGVRDPDLFARAVVAMTAAFHVAACLLLFRLLTRLVSIAAAVAVTLALLLPLGMVWRHVWGMENSLYACALVVALSYYLYSFRGRESDRTAALFGLLLGVTALSRLNAVLLAVCAVGAIVLEGRRLPLARSLRYGAIVAVVSAACVVPYLAWNYASTGHPLPISGAVKAVQTAEFLQSNGIDSRLSPGFLQLVASKYGSYLVAFVTWRIEDASTVVGGRLLLGEEGDRRFALLMAVVLALPMALGWRGWLAALVEAARRLRPLWYVAVFAAVNLLASVLAYPQQISNAMTKWWLVESELLIVIGAGTVIGTAVSHVGRLVAPALRYRIGVIAVAILVAAHGARSIRFYWDGTFQLADWNGSWNHESLRAANWLAANAPPDAVVGSWNAGVLGYYSTQPVTNLDGLINNFDLVPHLRDRTLGTYILHERITYLSDMEAVFEAYGIHDQLTLREVYRRRNHMMQQDYLIYRVEGRRADAGG